jgi:group I intron endonuclease
VSNPFQFDVRYRQSGIYVILNLANGKFYLGSAVKISQRWHHHLSSLRRGVHENPYLQAAWKKYGEDNFQFEVVERVEDSFWLTAREQVWINETRCFDRTIGYNLCQQAGSRLGVPVSSATRAILRFQHLGKKLSPETVQKIKLATKIACNTVAFRGAVSSRVSGDKNAMWGKTHSSEVKKQLSEQKKIESHERFHTFPILHPKCSFCVGVSQ